MGNKEIKKEDKKSIQKEKMETLNENIIIGKIKIKGDNLKQRIINSYENVLREEGKYCEWIKK